MKNLVGYQPGARPQTTGNALQGTTWSCARFPAHQREFFDGQTLFAQPAADRPGFLRSYAMRVCPKLLNQPDPGLGHTTQGGIVVFIPAMKEHTAGTQDAQGFTY